MATITNPRTLTIGALSRATGVKIETIRYYERVGLLPPPPRAGNGRRSYGQDQTQRLRFVRRGRELGFSLHGIRALLTLSATDAQSCAQAHAIASTHLADVRAKLDDLAKLEAILAETVRLCDTRCCAAELPVCPVLEVLAA